MLKRLSNWLHIFLTGILMTIITLILCFSFWNAWQSRQMADITYIQRVTSLIIYQLEADSSDPYRVLFNYEKEMNVYSILKDSNGRLLYQSTPDIPTDLEKLLNLANESIITQKVPESTSEQTATTQGGYIEINGTHHDSYYIIPATIRTQSGNSYTLALFYEQTSMFSLFLIQAPRYFCIWIVSFFCVLFVTHFLLKKAFEPTEQILQSQKNFVAAASHELKSPLAVIMANVETIQNIKEEDTQIQTSLKTIDLECSRMSRLVQDMLLLAFCDTDKWTIQKNETNADTLLITLYEAYEPVCIRKSIRLNFHISSESYPTLYTDRERLLQILSIFMDNAVYYSPKNSTVEIRTQLTSKELIFFVIDHGSGIAEKDKPFIFDRFYCADKSHTDKSHFGLGLSIAKELAKILDGKIGFQDTAGGGTTFFLILPIKPH